jgi:hypothetical protein
MKSIYDTGAYEKFIYYTSLTIIFYFYYLFVCMIIISIMERQNKDKEFCSYFRTFLSSSSQLFVYDARVRISIFIILFVLMHKFACDTILLHIYLYSFNTYVFVFFFFFSNRIWVIICKLQQICNNYNNQIKL